MWFVCGRRSVRKPWRDQTRGNGADFFENQWKAYRDREKFTNLQTGNICKLYFKYLVPGGL